jgi:hypothetical protein
MNCSQIKIAHSSNKEITMAQMKKPAVKKPAVKRPDVKPAPLPKKPAKMTPQDAAMKKLLEKKYGKIYG